MPKTITVISPAPIDKDAELLRLNAPFHAGARVSRGPLLTVQGSTTAHVKIRSDAFDREASDQAAAQVVDRGFAPAERRMFRGVEPSGVHPDTEVAGEEIIDSNATAPTVVPNRAGMVRTIAVRVLPEEIDLKFLVLEAVHGLRSLVSFIDRDGALAGRADGDHREGGE